MPRRSHSVQQGWGGGRLGREFPRSSPPPLRRGHKQTLVPSLYQVSTRAALIGHLEGNIFSLASTLFSFESALPLVPRTP